MARDWVSDRTTDTTSPFLLRRDVLEPLEEDISEGGSGGQGGRTVTFSQPAGAPAIVGGSPKFIVPFDASTTALRLSTVAAPEGGPATVQCLINGSVVATLQIADGSTATTNVTGDLPALGEGQALSVNSTEVGADVAAQGLALQWELS